MMSVASFPQIAQGLIEAGMESDMDAAVIENGTMPNQRNLFQSFVTSRKLSQKIRLNPCNNHSRKGMFLSEKLDWFSKLPLYGCNVLVTGPKKHRRDWQANSEGSEHM